MISYPGCKINIGLNVLQKRPDGFHAIESVFIPVPWHDALEIIPDNRAGAQGVQFTSSGLPVPGNTDDNLCVKAYHLLATDYALPPVKIHLHKVIPMGAGLGGGSSDGAHALMLINQLFNLKIKTPALKKYAAVLGSDCPFFIDNKPAFVYGRGEKMKPVSVPLSGLFLVIIHPGIHINTGTAYRMIQRKPYLKSLNGLGQWKLSTWKKWAGNDFEGYAFEQFPLIRKLKESLYTKGAIYASMSGSGSAVFGIFAKPVAIPAAWRKYTVFSVEIP